MKKSLTVMFWFSKQKIVEEYSYLGISRILEKIKAIRESYLKNPNDVNEIISTLDFSLVHMNIKRNEIK